MFSMLENYVRSYISYNKKRHLELVRLSGCLKRLIVKNSCEQLQAVVISS